MFILHIEHPVMSFDDWKKAFDNDPVDRRKSGVRRYRVMRPVDDDRYVMIDLEFDNRTEAETTLADLRVLWGNVRGKIIMDPKTMIVEVVEIKELSK
jgi:hypothetical protein